MTRHPTAITPANDAGGYGIPGGALARVLSARGIEDLSGVPRVGKSDMHCPDCYNESDILMIEGCKLDPCPKCRGVWLDSGELLRVPKLFPENSAVVEAEAGRIAGRKLEETGAAMSVIDLVGNLFLLVLR